MSAGTGVPAKVDVVALVASAGGLGALSDVLRDLPMDFPVPVGVQQHLGGQTSVLTTILARRSGHEVGWATDGATGTTALKNAGGIVIAQSEDTSEYPSMPQAAIAAGADLVLPLWEIGQVINDVANGEPLPR